MDQQLANAAAHAPNRRCVCTHQMAALFCVNDVIAAGCHNERDVISKVGLRKTDEPSFLPRDALLHSAVLRLHVVRLSVCDVGGSGSHRLEILETN